MVSALLIALLATAPKTEHRLPNGDLDDGAITFTHDGLTSRRTPLVNKLAQTVNVQDAPYYAACDGTTDDSAAVAAAKAQATAQGAQLVYPSGKVCLTPTMSPGQLDGRGLIGKTMLDATAYDFSTTSTVPVTTVGVANPYYYRPQISLVVTGSMAVQTWAVHITYTNANGETTPGPPAAVVVPANNQLLVTSPPASLNATGWNVYVQYQKQNSSPIAIGVNFQTTGPPAAGVAFPPFNTTGATMVMPAAGGNFYPPVGIPSPFVAVNYAPVYQSVLVDAGQPNEEVVIVHAATPSTFTAVFTKTHPTGFAIQSATGGIGEATMSTRPDPTLSNPVQPDSSAGATVLLPPSKTFIRAPIPLRNHMAWVGRGGARLQSDPPSQIVYTADTDVGKAAFYAAGSLGADTGGCYMRNFNIWSNSNGIFTPGILSITLEGMHVEATQALMSDIKAQFGTGTLHIYNSQLRAIGPLIDLSGAQALDVVIQDTRGDLGGSAPALKTSLSTIGGCAGLGCGGWLAIRNYWLEGGTGPVLDIGDMGLAQIDGLLIADWTGTSGTLVKVTNTRVPTSRIIFRNVFAPNQPGLGPIFTFAENNALGGFIYNVVLDNIQYNPSSVAVDFGTIRGPVSISNSNGINVSGGGNGGILNPPAFGYWYKDNTANGANGPNSATRLAIGPQGVILGTSNAGGIEPDSNGIKHKRFASPLGGGCPTAASVGAVCTSAALAWTTAFSDANYTISCTLSSPTGVPHIVNYGSKLAASFTLTIAAATAVAANAGADCIAIHD
jgi:hypothetical protein